MMSRRLLFGLVIIVSVLFLSGTIYENFISSGALVQLAAKGPQDWYLTGWPENHGNYWYPYGLQYGRSYPYLYGLPYYGNANYFY